MGVRRAVQDWLEARWYRAAPVPFWLRGLERLFAGVSRRRRRKLSAQAIRLSAPVVVVGNITVGGSGKTPLTIALVELLRRQGWRPGVVSRGYGGSARGVHRVMLSDEPVVTGDEPLLIARRTGVPVFIGRDRVAAGQAMLDQTEVDIVVADDGLQHYRLARDAEIAVVDGRRRSGNGRLLPAGPLREPVARLDEVGLVLVNGTRAADEPGFDLVLGQAVPLRGGPPKALSEFAGTVIHAVAGIGDPSRFFDALSMAGLTVIAHPFPDHHAFRADDLAFADNRPVLMTEKDAVKCREFASTQAYAVPATAILSAQALAGLGALFEHLSALRPSR